MKRSVAGKRPSISIFLVGVFLACFGLLAIFNASVVDAYQTFGDKYHYVKQQSTWLMVGMIASIVISRIPVELIKKNAHLIFLATIVLMILVIIPGVGSKFMGARRWLVVGPVVIQPSELLKIAVTIYLAKWLEKGRTLQQFLAIIGLNTILIMLQPDLGTAIVVVGVSFLIYYLSGVKISDIIVFSSILAFATVMLIALSPYRLNRVRTFMDPTQDPLGSSYHINQVLYGLGSGGVNGVGLGRSRQKYAYLPEATTDSIFVIIAEELGFIGGTILICALTVLSILSLKISIALENKFDKLLASGVSLLFLLQMFVNLGSMVALIPLTGVPLPFISYGGSSLITSFIALGLLMNLSKKA